jgi:hypothetical protein
MKFIVLASLLLSLNAAAAKPVMSDDVAEELAELLLNGREEQQEVEEAPEVEEDQGFGRRALGWFRRQADRAAEPLERRNNRSETQLSVMTEKRVEEILAEYSLGTGWSEDTLKKLTPFMGVKIFASFEALPAQEREAALNEVMDVYSRLPVNLVIELRKRGRGIELVADNVTNHPAMASYANVRPRGWAEGRTWSEVPGAGATGNHGTIIAGNSLHQGHGSVDLILHEVGHTVDRYFKDRDGGMEFSNRNPFSEINALTPFSELYGVSSSYQQSHTEENFAEMFAYYFNSDYTRAHLQRQYPEGFRYMSEAF